MREVLKLELSQVNFAEPSELRLHFGDLSDYDPPQPDGLRVGAWELGSCESGWKLIEEEEVVLEQSPGGKLEDYERAQELLWQLVGQRLTCIEVWPHRLRLSFELGQALLVEGEQYPTFELGSRTLCLIARDRLYLTPAMPERRGKEILADRALPMVLAEA